MGSAIKNYVASTRPKEGTHGSHGSWTRKTNKEQHEESTIVLATNNKFIIHGFFFMKGGRDMRQDKISMEHPYTTLHFSIKRGHNRIFFGTNSARTSDWIFIRGTVPWTGPIRFPACAFTPCPCPCLLFMCPPWGRTNGDRWRLAPAAPRVQMDSCGP